MLLLTGRLWGLAPRACRSGFRLAAPRFRLAVWDVGVLGFGSFGVCSTVTRRQSGLTKVTRVDERHLEDLKQVLFDRLRASAERELEGGQGGERAGEKEGGHHAS